MTATTLLSPTPPAPPLPVPALPAPTLPAPTLPALTYRDRSVLRAVAAGRCTQHGPGCLTVDGLALADQFAGLRLCEAGLITTATGAVALTDSGLALLTAA